ncbi:MAG: 50S ribosomal protein L21 [Planctomycetota bacterium]|nr:50S ribosomal protein L21 [Planctomycetota bacterium]
MYAIIEESGGQRKVSSGDEILIDLYREGQAAEGEELTFDRVLVIGEVGGGAKIGLPYVAGAKVTGTVIEPVVMGKKIYVQHFREKKTWRKKTGHRQRYTRVRVTGVTA